jgi:spermidine/putrescine transport system permease protein
MKKVNLITAALGLMSLAFLYLPLLAVMVFSVNSTKYGLTWGGFTWDWYQKLFQNEQILELTRNTLFLAVVSTVIATVLGTALALGLERYPWGRRFRDSLETVLYLPVVTPDIILAAALVVAFGFLQTLSRIFEPGMITMIIGHVTFQVAFVTLVVQSRLIGLGRDLEEAAYDLYSSYPNLLRRVLLPLLAPGIAAGAMLAFTLSLDDFIISLFTSGPSSQTLPLFIYGSLRRGVTPEIHALSTLIFLATVVLVLTSERLGRKKI